LPCSGSSILQAYSARSRGFARAARGACGALDLASVRLREGFAVFGKKGESHMLRIYADVLDWLEVMREVADRIGRHDSNLAEQLKRSSSSVGLNLGEGMYARGRQRNYCYSVSLREMGESYAALQIAQRLRYIAPLDPAFDDLNQKILATLVKLVRPRR
jgi:four helix bundle protein